MNTTTSQPNPKHLIFAIVVSILIIIVFASCNPCRRLTRLCPPKVYDSITYTEKIKLDTLIITLPGDTSYIEVPITMLEDLGILTDNAKQKVELKIKDGILKLKTICKEDSMQVVITELTKELSEKQIEIRFVDKEVPVKYVTTFRKVCTWGFFSLIILFILIIYIKFKNKIINTFKRL